MVSSGSAVWALAHFASRLNTIVPTHPGSHHWNQGGLGTAQRRQDPGSRNHPRRPGHRSPHSEPAQEGITAPRVDGSRCQPGGSRSPRSILGSTMAGRAQVSQAKTSPSFQEGGTAAMAGAPDVQACFPAPARSPAERVKRAWPPDHERLCRLLALLVERGTSSRPGSWGVPGQTPINAPPWQG
jgi:hypothetical protein